MLERRRDARPSWPAGAEAPPPLGGESRCAACGASRSAPPTARRRAALRLRGIGRGRRARQRALEANASGEAVLLHAVRQVLHRRRGGQHANQPSLRPFQTTLSRPSIHPAAPPPRRRCGCRTRRWSASRRTWASAAPPFCASTPRATRGRQAGGCSSTRPPTTWVQGAAAAAAADHGAALIAGGGCWCVGLSRRPEPPAAAAPLPPAAPAGLRLPGR